MKEKEGNWKGGQNSEGRKNEKERKGEQCGRDRVEKRED